MDANTQALIVDATRGDELAVGELFERYIPELEAFVRLHMGKKLAMRESCSDLVQSACREVLQDLADFEYRGEMAFKQLLFLQAQRKLASRGRFHTQQCRDVGCERSLDPDVYVAGAASLLTPSRHAIGREEMQRFLSAVEGLPEEPRRVLLLCRGLGMTPSEAAAELGKTANGVRVILHRALARLAVIRERLGRD